jgi:hypothetical protein
VHSGGSVTELSVTDRCLWPAVISHYAGCGAAILVKIAHSRKFHEMESATPVEGRWERRAAVGECLPASKRRLYTGANLPRRRGHI